MSKTLQIIIGIIVVIIIISLIFVFSEKKKTERETIKIGAILALTGKYQKWGQHMREGIDLAVEEINENGGINGRKLIVVYEDSQTDAKLALTAYRKLVDIDGIKTIIVAHSSPSKSIAAVAQKEKVTIFAISAVAPGLPETGDYIFRNDINIDSEVEKLTSFVYGNDLKKVALVLINTEGGVMYGELFKEKFENLGGKITIVEKYEKGTKDFRPLLTKVKATNPEAIYGTLAPHEAALVLKQAKELGIEAQFLCDFHCEGSDLLEAGELAEGIIYSHVLDLTSRKKEVQNFLKAFREKYGKEPEYGSALAFDTVKILSLKLKIILGLLGPQPLMKMVIPLKK